MIRISPRSRRERRARGSAGILPADLIVFTTLQITTILPNTTICGQDARAPSGSGSLPLRSHMGPLTTSLPHGPKSVICFTTIVFLLLTTIVQAQAGSTDPWVKTLSKLIGLTVGDLNPNFPDPRNRPPAGSTPTTGSSSSTGSGTTGTPGTPGASARTTPGAAVASDPSAPPMSDTIREWISIAEPPENATRGANLRYTFRGNMVGTVPGAIISSPHETGIFDPVYLWTSKRTLDSVNHCTMEQYVMARLKNQDITGCRGRYTEPQTTAIPDLRGRSVTEAKADLSGRGLAPVIRPGSPAPSADLSGRVESISPAAGARVEPGSQVVITVYSPFVDLRTVPNVKGAAPSAAKASLQQSGLLAELRPGSPAPTPELSGKVEMQQPQAGEKVKAGVSVVFTVHSNYVALSRVPDVRGLGGGAAKGQLSAAGFPARLKIGPPAPSPAQTGTVASQDPPAGAQVKAGSEVSIIVFTTFTDTVVVPSVQGIDAVQAEDRIRAAGLVPVQSSAGAPPSADSAGKVQTQTPEAGWKVKPGSSVQLAVYSFPATPEPTVPNVTPDPTPAPAPPIVAPEPTPAPPPPAEFYIANVVHPWQVVNNGPGEALSVSWTGNPTFPVTMIYRPRPGFGCLMGGCTSPQQVFPQFANPLIFPGAIWCRGATQPLVYFDYEVLLVDANGLQTPPFAAPFNCVSQGGGGGGQPLTQETIVAYWNVTGTLPAYSRTSSGHMQLFANGTYQYNLVSTTGGTQSTTITGNGSWSLQGDRLTLTFDAGAVYTGQASGNSSAFTMVSSNGWTLNFVRRN